MEENKKLLKIEELSKMAYQSTLIAPHFYEANDVKRGLRDINGNGVLAGLTEISDIISFNYDKDGNKIPCEGILRYRGIDIKQFVSGCISEKRFGFEEVTYLLLFGKLPSKTELDEFNEILKTFKSLPPSFVRDIIMKATSQDLMNMLSRSILTLYSYDSNADDISISNVLRQSLSLIAQMPMIAVYCYQAFSHYHGSDSLIIHNPDPEQSTAETILYLLRHDKNYSDLEARLLDLCLILHAEHGGGNNSTFTTHVVTSTGTDTYSTIAASLGSLKGPRHGGANIKVVRMMEDLQKNVKNRTDDNIKDYLLKLLNKEAFDRSGLIYGVGHAVYSLSDPRTEVLKNSLKKLAVEKHLEEEFDLYTRIEKLAPEVIAEKRNIYKGVSANVDFYSGLVYKMLGLPLELYTPLFAVSRIVGWSAHRIEELSNNGKIIRPGYKAISEPQEYVPLRDRG